MEPRPCGQEMTRRRRTCRSRTARIRVEFGLGFGASTAKGPGLIPGQRTKIPHPHWVAEREERTSLVVQWIRICLPTQGTQVQSLVREDASEQLKPTSCNDSRSCIYCSPLALEPALRSKRNHRSEKPSHRD